MNLIKEFLEFRKIRKELDVMEIDAPTRTRLNLEDGAFEKKVNEVLLMGLAKTIIREGLSNEFAAGFKSALLLRSSLKDKKELK